jgi:hypothetical protein
MLDHERCWFMFEHMIWMLQMFRMIRCRQCVVLDSWYSEPLRAYLPELLFQQGSFSSAERNRALTLQSTLATIDIGNNLNEFHLTCLGAMQELLYCIEEGVAVPLRWCETIVMYSFTSALHLHSMIVCLHYCVSFSSKLCLRLFRCALAPLLCIPFLTMHTCISLLHCGSHG